MVIISIGAMVTVILVKNTFKINDGIYGACKFAKDIVKAPFSMYHF